MFIAVIEAALLRRLEIRVLRNEQLLWSRIFENGDLVLGEAEEERKRMVKDGWISR